MSEEYAAEEGSGAAEEDGRQCVDSGMSEEHETGEKRESLFAPETLAGLRAAVEEAEVMVLGDERAAAVRRCGLAQMGVEAADAGRVDDARRLLSQAMGGTKDSRLLFLAYQFCFRTGDSEGAEALVRRRLELAGVDTAECARAWNNLGLIYHFRGEAATAEEMMRRALEIDRRIGHEEGIARDLGNLSLIPEAKGELEEAVRLNRESLAIAERIGAKTIAAGRLCNLGEIALRRGEREEARGLLVRAEGMFAELGLEKQRRVCRGHLEGMGGRDQGI